MRFVGVTCFQVYRSMSSGYINDKGLSGGLRSIVVRVMMDTLSKLALVRSKSMTIPFQNLFCFEPDHPH